MAKITGKNTRPGSNKATGRDYSKESAYQSTPARNKYRAELNAEARDRGIYGKRAAMGKDLSHKKDGKMVLESKSLNRARNASNGKSSKK
tara:strand:+ start:207 stop:476 length:270 start_codon:yes stop_codon:yes gene_type:complete